MISIIIPLYNKQDSLNICLASVLQQTLDNYEIIVIDDGSTDNSYAIAKEYKNDIILVKQSNSGPSAARNHGAKLASNNILLFLDADDELSNNALERHVEIHNSTIQTHIGLVSCGFQVVSNTKPTITKNYQELLKNQTRKSYEVIHNLNKEMIVGVAAGSFSISKKLHKIIGGFDEKLLCWEITDYLIKATLLQGFSIVSNDILLKINSNDNNSQFGSASKNMLYTKRYIENLIQSFKSAQRREIKEIIYYVIGQFHYLLWQKNEISVLKKCIFPLYHQRIDKFLVAYFLPTFILRLIRRFRSIDTNK